jgi:hypothetical protein
MWMRHASKDEEAVVPPTHTYLPLNVVSGLTFRFSPLPFNLLGGCSTSE